MFVVTKAVAEIAPAADDAESATGKFDVILSAETTDRDGDTLLRDEWKQPLPDHITFDIDHGMSVATTVGSGSPYIADDGTLRVAGTYSSIPRAQEVRTLVNEGHIRTTSVAFLTEKSKKGATSRTTRELLNGAFVAVPSNREAVVLSSKAFDVIEAKAGARNSASDQELLQSAHDKLAAMGATCSPDSTKAVRRRPEVKAIEGSVEHLQARVMDALEDAYDSRWPYLRGVLPSDGGGTAVFDVAEPDGWEIETYKQTFTDDGSVVTLTGTASPVDVLEVVRPDADADREPEDDTLNPDGDVTSAPAAAKSADESEEVTLRARALAARARVAAL